MHTVAYTIDLHRAFDNEKKHLELLDTCIIIINMRFTLHVMI